MFFFLHICVILFLTAKDGNLLKVLKEIDLLSDDAGKLQKLADISSTLR